MFSKFYILDFGYQFHVHLVLFFMLLKTFLKLNF